MGRVTPRTFDLRSYPSHPSRWPESWLEKLQVTTITSYTKRYRSGAIIVICRSGDVIPKIIDVENRGGPPLRFLTVSRDPMLSDSKASIRQNDFTSFSLLSTSRTPVQQREALRKRYSLSQRYRLSHRNVLQLFVVPKQEPMYHTISARPSTGSYVEAIVATSAFAGIGERILHAVHDSYPGRPMESLDVDDTIRRRGRKVEGQQIITGIQAAYGVPLRIRTDRRTTQTPSD
jgi:hypothetical protein